MGYQANRVAVKVWNHFIHSVTEQKATIHNGDRGLVFIYKLSVDKNDVHDWALIN